MHKLNETATRIFLAVLAEIPEGETHIKIQRGKNYMPLCVEKLYDGLNVSGSKATVYSFAHYYKQNGDMMKDPDVEFAVVDNRTPDYPILDLVAVYPMTYQQDGLGLYREYVEIENQTIVRFQEHGQKDCALSCNKWMNNIKMQQKISPLPVLNITQFAKQRVENRKNQTQNNA